jgi:hypothetical protein
MTTPKPPALRLAGPIDLLCAIPYLLGFHPQESLVVVGVDGTRLIVTARLDLADARESLLIHTLAAIDRGGATSVGGVLFTDQATLGGEVDRAFTAAARQVGLDLSDVLVVTGGRWRSLRCTDTDCCPPQGRELPDAPTAVDAAAVHAGLTALPRREMLSVMFAPDPDRSDLTLLLRHHEREHDRANSDDTLRDHHQRSVVRAISEAHWIAEIGQMASDDEAARFAVALRSDPVRDAVWLDIEDGRLDGIQLWVNLARRLPHPYDAAPLFLAGWAAYRHGNGILAGIAADLAVTADPACQTAELLRTIIGCGISPHELPKLSRSASPEADAT